MASTIHSTGYSPSNPITRTEALKHHFYPESQVGGYSRADTSIEFYQRLSQLLGPDDVVLDFGAGRGRTFHEDDCRLRRDLMTIRGKVRRVIGIDLDPVVMTNPGLDEAHVFTLAADGSFVLPIADRSVDLILSDWVFEHVGNGPAIAREFERILKPGGWICARTPNRWGYIALGATLIPAALQAKVLKLVQPNRKEEDVFPKHYRLNTRAAIRAHFDRSRFASHIYMVNAEPHYAGSSKLLWRAFLLLHRLLPPAFTSVMLVFARKAA